ncbi:MAG: ABC transporter ATP-binding protein, partial [Thermodesulfobacteriota bacterium]
IWALKDINFEVKHGEIVGVIGRNGAGKSTLLKILSRITAPTDGIVRLNGRVGSLLEVGTGFHPELTGRENIFLNGSILGMSKKEIIRKFDEIVDFAEIEKFLDTPVKRYSSGMYVRLAFAVAAHLEPEILLVDEVLAVGDIAFQKKCMGKMGDVSKEGRTILFVSHNMASITRICKSVLWLNNGEFKLYDETQNVITEYLNSVQLHGAEVDNKKLKLVKNSEEFELDYIKLYDSDNNVTSEIDTTQNFYVEVSYEIKKKVSPVRISIRLMSTEGSIIFQTNDLENHEYAELKVLPGKYKSICKIPGGLLNEGNFGIALSIDIPFEKVIFYNDTLINFSAHRLEKNILERKERSDGYIKTKIDWDVHKIQGI